MKGGIFMSQGQFEKIGILGTGTIGSSWASLLRAESINNLLFYLEKEQTVFKGISSEDRPLTKLIKDVKGFS